MCGRYNLISNLTVLGERFRFDANQLTLEAAYNVAPTQDVLTVVGGESRRAGGSGKRPMRVAMRSREPFAFAGIWSMWKDPEDNSILTCAIITTSANELLKPIHHRMPVILPRNMEGFWLDRSVEDPGELRSVLTPYPDAAMEAYEVSTLVNSVANDGPEVIARVA